MAEETQIDLSPQAHGGLGCPRWTPSRCGATSSTATARRRGRCTLDLYYPPHQESRTGLPALVFVMGYPDAGMQAIMGCRAKEIGQYTSWARLAAASGMVGVTYSAPGAGDATTLEVLRYLRENARSLGLDPDRIAMWSCSGNVPNALGVLMQRGRRARSAAPSSATASCSTSTARRSSPTRRSCGGSSTPAAGRIGRRPAARDTALRRARRQRRDPRT